MRRTLTRYAILGVAGLFVGLVGCDSGKGTRPQTGAKMDGTVMYGDQKVMVALVIATGANGSSQAFIDDDGMYHMENVPLGEVNIAVNTDAGKGNQISKIMAASRGKPKAMPRVLDVPNKYFDPTKSGIKTTVNAGDNTFNIVLPK